MYLLLLAAFSCHGMTVFSTTVESMPSPAAALFRADRPALVAQAAPGVLNGLAVDADGVRDGLVAGECRAFFAGAQEEASFKDTLPDPALLKSCSIRFPRNNSQNLFPPQAYGPGSQIACNTERGF
jgi:hypothetical protein